MVTTLPHSGEFTFKCMHCEFDTNKPPIKKKWKEQDMTLFFCGQCKGATLIRFDEVTATCFKVQS